MSTMLNNSVDNVKDIMSSARNQTEDAAKGARSVVLDGIHAAAGIVSILRGFGLTDALGWFGLARRRGGAGTLAAFGGGIALGAGLGMLFAPVSGADARRAIFGRLKGLARYADRTADKVSAGAGQAEKKVEDLAGKAKGAVLRVEHDIENLVSGHSDTAREAAKGTAGAPDGSNHHTLQAGR